MKLIKLPSILALSLFVLALPLAAPAADAAEKPAASETTKKAKPIQYEGTVSSVDKDKKTLALKLVNGDDLTIVVTDATTILNKKKPAKFEDVTEGAYVTGSYLKDGDTINAHSVHLGNTPRTKGSKKAKATPPVAPDAPAK